MATKELIQTIFNNYNNAVQARDAFKYQGETFGDTEIGQLIGELKIMLNAQMVNLALVKDAKAAIKEADIQQLEAIVSELTMVHSYMNEVAYKLSRNSLGTQLAFNVMALNAENQHAKARFEFALRFNEKRDCRLYNRLSRR